MEICHQEHSNNIVKPSGSSKVMNFRARTIGVREGNMDKDLKTSK